MSTTDSTFTFLTARPATTLIIISRLLRIITPTRNPRITITGRPATDIIQCMAGDPTVGMDTGTWADIEAGTEIETDSGIASIC